MNWPILLLAFALAVFMGAASASLVSRLRPGWGRRRQMFAAAALLPAFTLALTLLGILYVFAAGSGPGENMTGLAIVAMASIGGFFAALAFLGGVVGAAMAQRRQPR